MTRVVTTAAGWRGPGTGHSFSSSGDSTARISGWRAQGNNNPDEHRLMAEWLPSDGELLEHSAGLLYNTSSGHSHSTALGTVQSGPSTPDLLEGYAQTQALQARMEVEMEQHFLEMEAGNSSWINFDVREFPLVPDDFWDIFCGCLWTKSVESGGFATQEELRAELPALMAEGPAVPSQLFVLTAEVPEPRAGSVDYGLSAKQQQALVLLAGLQDVRCKSKRVKKETREMLHSVCGIEKKTLKKWCKNKWTVHCGLAGCSC